MKKLLPISIALALTGCSTFTTDQIDRRYDKGELSTEIRTKARSRTFFDSDSALTNFEAKQTEKTQGATVGALNQASSATNTVEALQAIDSILEKVR